MSGSWIGRIRNFFKRMFRWKTGNAVPLPDVTFLERIRCKVLDGSLKIYSGRHPDIRVVAVDSFVDAYRHFISMSDQKQLTYRYGAGHYYYTVTLPQDYGRLILTDNVDFRRDGTVAVLKIQVAGIMPLVKEIRYQLTE
jgi:hypothetical protein